MKRNRPTRLRWLTLTDDDRSWGFKLEACPLCWTSPKVGDRLVVHGKRKGASGHVCSQCAEGIAELVRSGDTRRCSRHECSATFHGRGRYCSNACRQAAYRARLTAP